MRLCRKQMSVVGERAHGDVNSVSGCGRLKDKVTSPLRTATAEALWTTALWIELPIMHERD